MPNAPLYRAEGLKVFKRPITTTQASDRRGTTMGFLVCTVTEALGEDGAQALADMLDLADDGPRGDVAS